MLGRTLDGRFTMLARLGAGSMGTVYRARHRGIGRDVALKILRRDRAIDEHAKRRFLREARANCLLSSPHTVTVFDFGQAASGELFLAMELLEGESLGQRMRRLIRIPIGQALEICRQALQSLGEAHSKGIIHRDLKPDNLFHARILDLPRGEEILKVLDFGIAKIAGNTGEPMNAVETQAGTVFGTPRYMSPEQAQGKPLDGRSDFYSLGVILYEMITGRPPFTDEDAVVVMARHVKTPPPSMAKAAPDLKLPPNLEALVTRLLSKDVDSRPATTETLLGEIADLASSAKAITRAVGLSTSTARPLRASRTACSRSIAPASRSLEPPPLEGRPPHVASRVALALVVVAACGAAAFGTRELRRIRGGTEAQPGQGIGAAAPAAPSRQDAPSAIPESGSIPTVSVEELPRATAPTAEAHRTAAAKTPPMPPPAASQEYGLHE
jgi:eukaryotic-like serine/threonine-protein kinase